MSNCVLPVTKKQVTVTRLSSTELVDSALSTPTRTRRLVGGCPEGWRRWKAPGGHSASSASEICLLLWRTRLLHHHQRGSPSLHKTVLCSSAWVCRVLFQVSGHGYRIDLSWSQENVVLCYVEEHYKLGRAGSNQVFPVTPKCTFLCRKCWNSHIPLNEVVNVKILQHLQTYLWYSFLVIFVNVVDTHQL